MNCFGGTMTWLAATRIEDVAAAVDYYGSGGADAAGEQPRCPTMPTSARRAESAKLARERTPSPSCAQYPG